MGGDAGAAAWAGVRAGAARAAVGDAPLRVRQSLAARQRHQSARGERSDGRAGRDAGQQGRARRAAAARRHLARLRLLPPRGPLAHALTAQPQLLRAAPRDGLGAGPAAPDGGGAVRPRVLARRPELPHRPQRGGGGGGRGGALPHRRGASRPGPAAGGAGGLGRAPRRGPAGSQPRRRRGLRRLRGGAHRLRANLQGGAVERARLPAEAHPLLLRPRALEVGRRTARRRVADVPRRAAARLDVRPQARRRHLQPDPERGAARDHAGGAQRRQQRQQRVVSQVEPLRQREQLLGGWVGVVHRLARVRLSRRRPPDGADTRFVCERAGRHGLHRRLRPVLRGLRQPVRAPLFRGARARPQEGRGRRQHRQARAGLHVARRRGAAAAAARRADCGAAAHDAAARGARQGQRHLGQGRPGGGGAGGAAARRLEPGQRSASQLRGRVRRATRARHGVDRPQVGPPPRPAARHSLHRDDGGGHRGGSRGGEGGRRRREGAHRQAGRLGL
mmetsp:Transcript_1523/g.4479  ORF Transcript_1523/g.4479 Transcript_1523/m.4479 type:complete len:504 (-) Transcript_1523:69-1580(-)